MTYNKNMLIWLTPIFVLLTHYLAVFPHEFMHSIVAWLGGFKANPLNITFGGTSWGNLLLLLHIDENVNYAPIFIHHGYYAAFIAFAGAGIANGSLFALSLWLLHRSSLQKKPILYYFVFWFNFMNLANFYDYIPIRTFTTHGDVGNFLHGLNLSPWWVFIIGGYIVFFLTRHFFTKTLAVTFEVLDLNNNWARFSVIAASVLIFFGFFSFPGLSDYGEISRFISLTAYAAIPGIMYFIGKYHYWKPQTANIC